MVKKMRSRYLSYWKARENTIIPQIIALTRNLGMNFFLFSSFVNKINLVSEIYWENIK